MNRRPHLWPRLLCRGPFPLCSIIALVALWALVFSAKPNLALAQESTPVTDPAPAATRAVTADEVDEIARELWCPLCSNVRLDTCELKACEQMREVIAIELAKGGDLESIRAYFVEQYGPQVLGAPPLEGFNWLAWILPIVAVVAGAMLLTGVAMSIRDRGRRLAAATHPEAASSGDRFENALDEELKKYD